jgi:hypothetical protein
MLIISILRSTSRSIGRVRWSDVYPPEISLGAALRCRIKAYVDTAQANFVMTTFCQPLPQSVGQEMLQVAARAICDRPGDKPFLRESRTRQMVYSVLGFEPRDGQEYMLATMIVGHYQLILDSMRQVFQGQMDSMIARTKSGIVSLDRAMLAFERDMRMAQRRPVARGAENASAPGPVEVDEWVADWAGVPPAAAARPEADPPRTTAVTPAQVPAETGQPATSPSAAASRTPIDPAPRPVAPGAAVMNRSGHSPPNEVDDETARHIAEFEAALATLSETLEEARAFDGGDTGLKAASGD